MREPSKMAKNGCRPALAPARRGQEDRSIGCAESETRDFIGSWVGRAAFRVNFQLPAALARNPLGLT